MIKYALVCDAGHEFESWFRDAASYDQQARRGLVACAVCGATRVGKAIMAPAVARRDRPMESPIAPNPPTAPEPVALLDERQQALRSMVRALHTEIAAKTDDVGRAFPDEARRIHEGEAPARSIRGQASLEEARALLEDGVPILPIPGLPDERN